MSGSGRRRTRHRSRLLAAAGVLLLVTVGACDGGDATETTAAAPERSPEAVASAFVEALIEGEYSATAELVDERHLAFLTAIERGSAGEVAGMLRGGVPSSVRNDFWDSFADALPSFTGESLGRIQVGDIVDRFSVGPAAYVAVDLFVADGRAEWILRDTGDGWVIDLLATFGTGFLPNLRGWFAFIGADEDAAYIRDQFEAELPSLQVGLDRLPLGPLSEPARAAADELLADFGS